MKAQTVLDAPAYGISEAAHYLRLPQATLRSWVMGRDYPVSEGRRRFSPVIDIADPRGRYLSFTNLVEAHVLSAIRRDHKVPLVKVRAAVEYLRGRYNSPRPLAEQDFETDGVDLFIQQLGQVINVSRGGQRGIADIIRLHLKRIDRNPRGVPIRLYPFTHSRIEAEPRGPIVIDPEISFGRPVIDRLGLATATIADRYKAGDSISELADDYGATPTEIEEAIRCELELKAA